MKLNNEEKRLILNRMAKYCYKDKNFIKNATRSEIFESVKNNLSLDDLIDEEFNQQTLTPGQWCWVAIDQSYEKEIKKFMRKDGALFTTEDHCQYYYCYPLTEQELINNGIKKKETMQEQISEELFIALFKVIFPSADADIIQISFNRVKQAGYIKESALDKVEKYVKLMIESREPAIVAEFKYLSDFYRSAIAEKDKEIAALKERMGKE